MNLFSATKHFARAILFDYTGSMENSLLGNEFRKGRAARHMYRSIALAWDVR
jgi:hypothetical protein